MFPTFIGGTSDFPLNVRKLFRNTFGAWPTATPPHREVRPTFRPGLEVLEERCCLSSGVPDAPISTSLFWDPGKVNNNAFTASNWDTQFLGNPIKAKQPPGDTPNEVDTIIFDGSQAIGNQNCNWNYKPLSALGAVNFQKGYNKTVSFTPNGSFSVQGGGQVSSTDAVTTPTIAPDGSSGVNVRPAIALLNGSNFGVGFSSTLNLAGFPSGNAIFMAGDGKAGEELSSDGTVNYAGLGSTTGTANTDYLKIPVDNSGTFKVNGDGNGTTSLGAILQVSGTISTANPVSYFQNNTAGETDIFGNGTLWCYNNFTMTKGKLQTLDAGPETLEVGTAGTDGIANILGGTVNIDPGANKFGKLFIAGPTKTNNPTVNVGIATLNFKLNQTTGSTECDQLIVGKPGSGGTLNFGAGGGTATVAFSDQGNGMGGNVWQPIWFNSVTKNTTNVTFSPGFKETWLPTSLEVKLA
jgi:hypothetical protein